MPRKGPRREIVPVRMDAETIAYLDETAADEQILDERGDASRSEVVRILIAYGRQHRPKGWRPTS